MSRHGHQQFTTGVRPRSAPRGHMTWATVLGLASIIAAIAVATPAAAQSRWEFVSIPGLPAGAHLQSVSVCGPNLFVWASVDGGTIETRDAYLYRWDRRAWSLQMHVPGFGAGVLATSATEAFAAVQPPDQVGLRMFHWLSGVWTEQTLPAGSSSPSGVIVGRTDDVYYRTGFGGDPHHYVLHYDGVQWGIAADLPNIGWGAPATAYVAPDQIYLATCQGYELWDGTNWTWYYPTGLGCDVEGAWGMRDGSGQLSMYVIGNPGFGYGVYIWRLTESFPGSKFGNWSVAFGLPTGYAQGYGHRIWGSAPNDVYAVCYANHAGHVYHYDGGSWTEITDFGPIAAANLLAGDGAEDVWVGMEDSRLLHFWRHTVIAPQDPGLCVSTVNPTVTVPVRIERTDATPLGGISATFRLSSNLQLSSGLASIVEGGYLSSAGSTSFHAIDNGDGSYTVDDVILGTPCGATAASGELFRVTVKKVPGADGTGTLSMTDFALRDCANADVDGAGGSPVTLTIDTAPPPAVTDLLSTQLAVDTNGDGTRQVKLTFTAPGDAALVEVYRAGFGNYPEYDDPPNPGSVPATPGYPPPAPWVLTAVTASGETEELTARDVYSYALFSKDACGNVSAVSNVPPGTLNYLLGDVHDGWSDCHGDNLVSTSDLSFLGAHYGITLGANDPLGCLDVGPTLDRSVRTRPTTDSRLNFEDLMVLAMNYTSGHAVLKQAAVKTSSVDALAVDGPASVEQGATFAVRVRLDGSGAAQGVSLKLSWNAAVAEPVSVAAGDLVVTQGGTVLSSEPGDVDAVLLGAREVGFTGAGDLAMVTFRALSTGEPRVGIASAIARDAANRTVPLGWSEPIGVTPSVPARTELTRAYPNPFQSVLSLSYSLARPGHVALSIYDLVGRRVRVLVNGDEPAGTRAVVWDGANDARTRLPAGFYVVRMDAGGVTHSRSLFMTH